MLRTAAHVVANQTVRISFFWPIFVRIPRIVATISEASKTSRNVMRNDGIIRVYYSIISYRSMIMNLVNDNILSIWNKYKLPDNKRIHVSWVARVAGYIGLKVNEVAKESIVDVELLHTASLLHDIDNGIPFLSGEVHPDAAVRILRTEHLEKVADIVKTHSLSSILDAEIMPKKWEEKVLYIADKMVKYEVITVDKRFALWRKEELPEVARIQLSRCYPLVKQLEYDIFTYIHVDPEHLSRILV